MSLVLSTSWNAYRYTQGLPLINEIKDLGFEEVELSFNLTSSMVDEIARAVTNKSIRVASVHNYCPIPGAVKRELALPDYYAMSSKDGHERENAVRQAKVTIDTAERLHAKAVVLHCGRVEIPDRTIELIALYNKGLKNSPEFSALRNDIISQRNSVKWPFLDNTLKSLDELNEYASRRGIKLGIETRYYFREIPYLDEIGLILDRFRGSQVFYWHDTGHAQLMENLGFVAKHEEFLDRYASRMIGVHLHDIRGCSDHQAPGTGDFDFKRVKPYISKATILVIEAHQPATGGEIVKASKFLEGMFNG